jgi:tetratricopeptide (TPR) repeat protein
MSDLPRLYLSFDPDLDWLAALEFGCVDEGQPSDRWLRVSSSFDWYLGAAQGPILGFTVLDFSEFDPEEPEVPELWKGPHFDVPLLGLTDASAGQIVLAARNHFNGRPSLNRFLFNLAALANAEDDLEEALRLWEACLESGDSMAHFAVGYTLYDLGRYQEAYRHLRHYVEIAPGASWNWCWFGKGAEAVGELEEARRAYERAIELEEAGDQETDAWEGLSRLRLQRESE